MKQKLGLIGLSILIALILFTAINTYTYIESRRIKSRDEIHEFIEGTITEIQEDTMIRVDDETFNLFNVTILDYSNTTKTYNMFFYQLYPPLQNTDFRLYYEKIIVEELPIYRVVRVDMI